jgi:hypothetical protein
VLSVEELSRGRRGAVFALVVDGRDEVADFLNDLPLPLFDKLEVMIERLADDGFIANQEKFRRLDAGVYELKLWRPPLRVFCFQHGPDWVCTHADRKPGSRELRSHVAKVKVLRRRYLEERR